MIFANKPKKAASTKPSDKRKISLLNTDFKVITGIEAKRLKDRLGDLVDIVKSRRL